MEKNKISDKWIDKDFEENKLYWKDRSIDENLKKKIDNLKLLNQLLIENDIFYFLEGNTLRSIFREDKLDTDDHDDDLGVFIRSKRKLTNLEKEFNKFGFLVIRSNKEMISVYRNKRYIDICLFKKSLLYIGYGQKTFPKKHYRSFKKLNYEDIEFNIPALTEDLLKTRYGNK